MGEKYDQQSRKDPFAEWREDLERASEAWLRMMPWAVQSRAVSDFMRGLIDPFAAPGQAPMGGDGEQTRERGQRSSPDPFAAWRDGPLESWAKVMTEMVNTRNYAEAMGATLDAYGALAEPFEEAVQSSVNQTLQRMNMPTRSDVTKILERLTNIEKRLDDLAVES